MEQELRKHVRSLQRLDLERKFSMICLSETWCSNDSFQNNSNYNLSQYNSVHQERKNKSGGGVCVYINKKHLFKLRKDFSVSEEENETLSIQIINKNTKNIIVNTCYRPPGAKLKPFKTHVTKILNSLHKKNQKIFLSEILRLIVCKQFKSQKFHRSYV